MTDSRSPHPDTDLAGTDRTGFERVDYLEIVARPDGGTEHWHPLRNYGI